TRRLPRVCKADREEPRVLLAQRAEPDPSREWIRPCRAPAVALQSVQAARADAPPCPTPRRPSVLRWRRAAPGRVPLAGLPPPTPTARWRSPSRTRSVG